jgi:hypothetical protein
MAMFRTLSIYFMKTYSFRRKDALSKDGAKDMRDLQSKP